MTLHQELHEIRTTHQLILSILKAKLNVTDEEMEEMQVEMPPPKVVSRAVKDEPPVTTWSSYTVDLAGVKMYKRPKGKAKAGWEWDKYKGTWVRQADEVPEEDAELAD